MAGPTPFPDDPLDMGTQRRHHVGEEIMSLRPWFRRLMHEHRDGGSDRLVHVNHEDFFFVAEKDGASAARREDGADFRFNDILLHESTPGSGFV